RSLRSAVKANFAFGHLMTVRIHNAHSIAGQRPPIQEVRDVWGLTIRDGYADRPRPTAQIGNTPGQALKGGSIVIGSAAPPRSQVPEIASSRHAVLAESGRIVLPMRQQEISCILET